MKRIAVLTRDKYLYRKIELELSESYSVVLADSEECECDLLLQDVDYFPEASERAVRLSRFSECDIPIPSPIGAIEALLNKDRQAPLALDEHRREAILRGIPTHLTKLEFSLLQLLFLAEGEFISREEISNAVWGGEATDTLINLYVHYLRSKLERTGERIILSSRSKGYAIDKKYLGGQE